MVARSAITSSAYARCWATGSPHECRGWTTAGFTRSSHGPPYGAATPLIGERLDPDLVRGQWGELLRLAASVRAGTVSASLMLKRLGSYPRQNLVAAALRELGRIERTLWTLRWIEDPEVPDATRTDPCNKAAYDRTVARLPIA